MERNNTKRDPKEYNFLRGIFQWLTCRVVYGTYYRIACGMKITGRENVPKDRFFIVASNHVSAIDPFLVIDAIGRHVAYMAKQELFEKPIARFFLHNLGAFAVNREKLGVSTIKTAIGIKKTNWVLGLFPQGTRDSGDRIEKITKGFASFAKATKTGILPVAIIGSDKKPKWPFSNNITVKIGKLIPYSDNIDDMMQQWCSTISDLTGKEYVLE